MTDAVDTEALDGANALDETSQDEAAPSDKDDVVHVPEDSWYGGLKLVSTLELDGAASDDGDPDIDVIHVTGLRGEEQRLRIHSILNFVTTRRELVFLCEIAHLLLGDLTREAIETAALRLLDSLVRLEDKDASEKTRQPKRAIVFVAYDLGALILKKALSIASRDIYKWPHRFTHSARVIFCGAPQRSDSLRVMEAKLFQFLRGRETNSWRNMLTLSSIRGLAQATLESTEEFLSSKFTLRGCIVSLYANAESPRGINPVFDEATATLGVLREISLGEQGEEEGDAFPTLATNVCQHVKQWVPEPDWVPVEQTLLSLSAPHDQLKTTKRLHSHPTVDVEHDKWVKELGYSLMYIHGTNGDAVRGAAEQLIAIWKEEQREEFSEPYNVYSFTFYSRDPLRHSASCMALSLVTHDLTSSRDDVLFHLVEDQFRLQNGWVEQEALTWLMGGWLSNGGACILLQDFDECDEQSRAAFLQLFKLRADGSEDTLKLLVTSRVPGALSSELSGWPELNIDRIRTENSEPPADATSLDRIAKPGASTHDPVGSLAYLCPTSTYAARLVTGLDQLKATGGDRSGHLLELLQRHSAWGEEPSTRSLTKFLDLMDSVSPTTTGADILARIINTLPDVRAARWILKWLLNSCRPLLVGELATILYLQPGESTTLPSEVTLAAISKAIDNISDWFRGLILISRDQVLVRNDVWSMFTENTGREKHFLADIGDQAHSSILQFSLGYLGDSNVQRRAMSSYEPYLARVQAAGDRIYPPMASDGRDPLSYIVMALPHHVSRDPGGRAKLSELLKDRNGPLELWSKLWWAMSNPLTRPRKPCPSAYRILAGLGLAAYREPPISPEERWGIIVEAARNNNKEIVMDLLRTEKDCPLSTLTDALEAATKAGAEELALSIMAEVLESRQQAAQKQPPEARVTTPWRPCLLWRAAWLNMVKFMRSLLENGMGPDPEGLSGNLFPSPLYMASRVGNAAAVRTLLEFGASPTVLRAGKYSSLTTAAANGHVEVIRLLVHRERKLLDMGQPYTPLYTAAGKGNWRAVTALLDLGADPNIGIKPDNDVDYWAPLCSAASWGQIKTVQALLDHHADANIRGPSNLDTPLWFATVGSASVPCCRALLDHKADPNHELLIPPLMAEIVNSDQSTAQVIAVSELLVAHSPPIDVEKADADGRTALMHASKSRDPALVKWLLMHGADAKSVDDEGRTSLFYATEAGRLDVVEELLQWEPDLMLTAPKGGEKSLLHVAFETGNNQLVKRLLEAGAEPDIELKSHYTLMNLATNAGNAEVVEMLIEHKANLDRVDRFGWTPLCDVVGYTPNAKIVRLLVDAGANVGHIMENSGRNLMHLAMGWVDWVDLEVIRILFEFPRAIDIDHCDNLGCTPLFCSREPEAVRLLLRAGANINVQNSEGLTPLMHAIQNEAPLETVELYLSQPRLDLAVCSKSVGSALHLACRMLNSDAVRKLVACGADVNRQVPVIGSSPLTSACVPVDNVSAEQLGKVDEIVSVLLGAGADVNAVGAVARDPFCTALSAAAFWARPSAIKILLGHGADAGTRDRLGRQAIHFAAANGAGNLRAVMRAHQGSVAVADNFGKTALHWAAQMGRLQALEELLSAVDRGERLRCVNEPDVDGWTPLCWAMRIFTIEWRSVMGKGSGPLDFKGVVRFLLENGADPLVRCRVGKGEAEETFTLLQLAHLYNVDDCIVAMVRDSLRGRTGASAAETETEEDVTKQYTRCDSFCDVCLCQVYGLEYVCSACKSFCACKKCYGRIDEYHGSYEGDEGVMHTINARSCGDEFTQPSESASNPKSAEDMTDTEARGEEGITVDAADSRAGQRVDTKEGDEDENDEDDEDSSEGQAEEVFDFFSPP